MLTIGLTGGYATGKSTVARLLRELGAVVVDADDLAHAAMRRGEPGWREVVEAFGRGILDPAGEVDRAALGRIVFADPARRKELEGIIHPKVIAAVEAAKERARAAGAPVFVCEAPLLFEAGMADAFDRVWVIAAPRALAAARAAERDKLPPGQVRARMDAQMPLAEKERRADTIIVNDGDLDCLARRVREAWYGLVRA